VAVYRARDRLLDRKAFLMVDFHFRQFFLERNREGRVDATETLPLREIDLVDFLSSVNRAEEFYNEDRTSSHHLNDLAAVPKWASRIMGLYICGTGSIQLSSWTS
jgi:hypothetical protein